MIYMLMLIIALLVLIIWRINRTRRVEWQRYCVERMMLIDNFKKELEALNEDNK
jgi:hypothetical protein